MVAWWVIVLIVIGVLAFVVGTIYSVLKAWVESAYTKILQNPRTECNIDDFVDREKNPVSAWKVVAAHKLQIGSRKASKEPIPLEIVDSPHVEGLKISRTLGTTGESAETKTIDQFLSESESQPIVVATIRMGFGHHRLAYSAASWALKTGRPTIFHDLLSIKSGMKDHGGTISPCYSLCSFLQMRVNLSRVQTSYTASSVVWRPKLEVQSRCCGGLP